MFMLFFFFFKQKTAYEMRISDWSSDVCSSDLGGCEAPWGDDSDRTESARDFPPADRPVAPTVSTKWSTEEARDRVNEAEDVMDSADVRPGMTDRKRVV